MTILQSSIVACFISALLIAVSADAAFLTVNSTADDGTGTCTASKCTLRDAVLSAASGDTIAFSLPANSAINLTNGQLLIDKNLTINGSNANLLTVQRSAAADTPMFRIFSIAGNFNVTFAGLTIANGIQNVVNGAGGGIYNDTGSVTLIDSIVVGNIGTEGGGIRNGTGRVTLIRSTLSGNRGTAGGGIINTGGVVTLTSSTVADNTATVGGGIYTQGGTLIVTNSTMTRNRGTDGGAINIGGGTLTVSNSTLSGNVGSGGGAIDNAGGTVTLTNSTISANRAANGPGGGIYNAFGTFNVKNTIIALNTATRGGPDIFGTVTSKGFNLIGNNTDATIAPASGDQIGTPGVPIDPLLGPLQDNGGPTQTQALLPGSKAIDKGDSSGSTNDQRGFTRPVDTPAIGNATGGDGSDIGAYEVQPDQLIGCSEINLVVNNNSDGSAGSLRSVIASACGGSTISFAGNVRGAITLTGGELLINKNLAINGPGANLLSVRRSAAPGTANFRIFDILANVRAGISGLTIANGNTPTQLGGGIYNLGSLTLTSVTISGNSSMNGGGIHNDFGTLTVSSSTIADNTVSSSTVAGSGGGIFNRGGTVLIGNSTISRNSARGPGGNSDSGGGIITNVGMVTLTNSTITGNSGDLGGGIRNVNGGVVNARNTIIALNTSAAGPDVNGPLNSQGFNLIGNASGATITRAGSDQIGATAADLNLGPLQDNGGPTPTHALLVDSFAIDKGNSGGVSADQRGFTRPVGIAKVGGGDGSDIGAFEAQAISRVVEFYNASLDHYFITWVVDEIAKLDEGTVIKGWTRTGQTFETYTTPQSGTSPVCRYYIPPGLGDSHFFGRGTDECNATGLKNPSFILEEGAFMHMFLPNLGVCPASSTPIYRVFSNRPDANHRYMTDQAIRDQMVANAWLAEGDGPDLVVMCAPQ